MTSDRRNRKGEAVSKAFAFALFATCLAAGCAHFQAGDTTTMPSLNKHYDNGNIKYRVWIPKDVEPRGIIFASMGKNWDYRHFVDNPTWQAAAKHWEFILVGTGAKGSKQCDTAKLKADIEWLLDEVAEDSGHKHIPQLPFCSYGFSIGGWFTRRLAATWPGRMIAGGIGGMSLAEYNRETKTLAMPPDPVKDIPFMVTIGELDTRVAEHWKEYLPKMLDQGFRIGFATQWGLPHYEGNYENILLVHFDRCIRHRLPEGWKPGDGPLELRTIQLENGWVASGTTCSGWGTQFVEAWPSDEAPDGLLDMNWFVDETMARAWQAYALRHNAAALVKPWVDSMDYIPSRNLPAPIPAGRSVELHAMSYWHKNPPKVEFYVDLEKIGEATQRTAGPGNDAYAATWKNPTPGIHILYAIITTGKGNPCITKPCPVVVAE